jgi:tetratricopeptide (TPR) repeat protein
MASAALASTAELIVYDCERTGVACTADGGLAPPETALVILSRQRSHLGMRVHLPQDRIEVIEWRDPRQAGDASWFALVVRGQDRIALLVDALWQRGRDPEWIGGLHPSHALAMQLMGKAMEGARGLRVGDNRTLEIKEVVGSGYFSIALGACLTGVEGEAEDVAVKIFVGHGAEDAFETEVRNMRTLTARIGAAALVVRLVGVVERQQGEGVGVALPWPAVVVTPLCVESLEQRIDRFTQEPYTLQEAMAWAGQVALSLHRLHRESRLRHGDVTLRNVLLGRDGRAYLADMGVAEHNHPYGRQPHQQHGPDKLYSASMAPEMIEEGGLGSSPSSSPPSDARADVWSWGVLLHALLTRSTATAKDGSVRAYLTMMQTDSWVEEAAVLWGPEELPPGLIKAVKHSLCERGERVGLLAGLLLLGQLRRVEETVTGMEAPESVKDAELRIATLESLVTSGSSGEGLTPPEEWSDCVVALAEAHAAVGDEAQAIACLQRARRICADLADDVKRAKVLSHLALAVDRRGDHHEAAALLQEVLSVRRRLLPEDHPDIITCLNNLASCLFKHSEYERAVKLYEEVLAMKRRSLPRDHPDIALSLHNLSNCHMTQGEYGKAERLLEEALEIKRRSLPKVHLDIASSLNNLASCYDSQGKYGKAISLHEEALAMRRRLLPEDHRDTATSLNNLASCHEKRGDCRRALRLYEGALAMRRRLLPEDHPDIANLLNNLATCHFNQGACGKAVALLEEALAMQRRLLPEDHRDIAKSLTNLASCYDSQGEYGKAVMLLEEALAMWRRLMPDGHTETATCLSYLATSHRSQGEDGKAVPLLEEALAMRRRLLLENHPDTESCLSSLADCYDRQGEYGKALPLYEEALARQRRRLPRERQDIATSLFNLATLHGNLGDHGRAVLLHKEALAVRQRVLPDYDPDLGLSYALTGGSLAAVDDVAGAVWHLEKALAVLPMAFPPGHPLLVSLLRTLTSLKARLPGEPARSPAPEAVDWSSKSMAELVEFLQSRGLDVDTQGELDQADLVQVALALAAEPDGHRQQEAPGPTPTAPPPQAEAGSSEGGAVDWSSRPVVELVDFLRSRGVDLGEAPDKEDLVQVAVALTAEEQGS